MRPDSLAWLMPKLRLRNSLGELDGGAGLLELLLGVLGILLLGTLEDDGGGSLHLVLGLLQAEAGEGADDLDDGDLVGAEGGELNVEVGLLLLLDSGGAGRRGGGDGDGEGGGHDPMLKNAVEVVIDAGQASTSLLQRRCKLGYARAARIMDEMEQMHIIRPYEGAKPRQVLISRTQWLEMCARAENPVPEEI